MSKQMIAIITLDARFAIIESHPANLNKLAPYFTHTDTSKCFEGGRFKKELATKVRFFIQSPAAPTSAMVPIGLLDTLKGLLDKMDCRYKIIDTRSETPNTITDEQIQWSLDAPDYPFEMRDYQIEAVRICLDNHNAIIKAATGAGKCFLVNTPILMFDESIKMIQDVIVGDQVMGPDLTPRNVHALGSGRETMYEIHQEHGIAYTVNQSHILSLKNHSGFIVDVDVLFFVNLSKNFQQLLHGWNYKQEFKTNHITVIKKKKNKYYGIAIDGDHRFCLGDGTVTHNTEIFTSLCKLTNRQTVILFKKIDLANQTLERMEKSGLDAGIVQGDNIDENHKIVMATVQSAHKLQRTDYTQIIVDEAHNASAQQYQDVLMSMDAPFRYGFSATPFTKDKLHNARVRAFIGDEKCDITAKELIDKGILAKPTIYMIPIKQATFAKGSIRDKIKKDKKGKVVKKVEVDVDKLINPEISDVEILEFRWAKAEKFGLTFNYYRNQIITQLANSLNGQILVLVKFIEHGEMLKALIPDAEFIFGKTTVKDRKHVMERFELGEKFVLIGSTILDEGIDIKSVNKVILTSGGISFVKVMQRIGRGMRIKKDAEGTVVKDSVDVFDFYDDTNPILLKHSRERIKIYRDAQYDVLPLKKIEDYFTK
jgi:superfamily II DNA or RNA helicase